MANVEQPCPVCDGTPRVLIVVRHPAMLRFTRELLEREFGCWVASEACTGPRVGRLLQRHAPDVIVIDAADFPACCLGAFAEFPRERVIVIGPEPDASYRAAALTSGAGAWLPRERVGEDLSRELRRVLGCVHDPCPPGRVISRSPGSAPAPDGGRSVFGDHDRHEHQIPRR